MNLLEEMPKSNPSSGATKSNSMFSNPFVSNSSSMSSKPIVSTTAPPVAATTTTYTQNEPNNTMTDHMSLFDIRTLLIIILLVLIALTYFGINILSIFGTTIEKGVDMVSPFVSKVLDLVGYSSGKVINTAADVGSDVAKEGVEIAEGAVKSMGNILIGDEAIGKQRGGAVHDPSPDVPEDNIQKSLSASKSKWCLVGEYQNKRGCIDISESDKCLSGQVFPNEEMCLNPAMMMEKPHAPI